MYVTHILAYCKFNKKQIAFLIVYLHDCNDQQKTQYININIYIFNTEIVIFVSN